METNKILELVKKAEDKVNSTMLSNIRKTEINLILLEIQKEAINYSQCSKLLPDELKPVLARIEQINSLGKSGWWEVVYYDGKWCSYGNSKTFNNGEKVVDWEYCKATV